VLRPDPEKVKDFLRRGATVTANWIDHLSEGLTAFSATLEQALVGKVQANLYVSSRRRQGLAAHRDRHDVYPVHVEGTKTWHVYEGRSLVPTAHPMFKTTRAEDEEAKGGLLMEVKMEPGDLLYLPRGQYHDALADEGGAMHIAFGVTYPNGLDVLSLLQERAVAEPLFRTDLPRPRGPDAERTMTERLAGLAEGINRLLSDRATAARIRALQLGFHHPRDSHNLPDLFAETAEDQLPGARQGHASGAAGRPLRPGTQGLARRHRGAAQRQPAGRMGARAPGVLAQRSRRRLSRARGGADRPAAARSRDHEPDRGHLSAARRWPAALASTSACSASPVM
jgi:hypothetical protein